MSTPKEEALRLMDNFENAQTIKDCALIAVDEIIESMPKEPIISTLARVHLIMFWVEVKQEIEKL